MDPITLDYFSRIDFRVGTIREAGRHPNADRLLVLQVELDNGERRQVVAGISQHYQPEALTEKQVLVVTNLEPATLRGVSSQGMILAASDGEGHVTLLGPHEPIKPGSKVK